MTFPLNISLAFAWISSMLLLMPFNSMALSSTACINFTKTVHPPLGWPAVVSCAGHATFYEDAMIYGEITEDTIVYCSITDYDTSEVVLEKGVRFGNLLADGSHDLGEIQSMLTRKFQVITKIDEIDQCHNQTLIVSPRILEPKSCEEAIASEGFIKSYDFEATRLKKAWISVFSYEEADSFKYHNIPLTWGRNCTGLPRKTRVRKDQVRIKRVHFSHAGIYVASFTYKSMTMFVKQVNFCVKERSIPSNNIIVECKQDVYKVKRNSDVLIACRADLQYEKPMVFLVSTEYVLKDPNQVTGERQVCKNPFVDTNVHKMTSQPAQEGFTGSCASLLDSGNQECYLYDPVKIKQEKTYLYGNLKLRIDSDDKYGNYTFKIVTPSYELRHEFNFTIVEDLE